MNKHLVSSNPRIYLEILASSQDQSTISSVVSSATSDNPVSLAIPLSSTASSYRSNSAKSNTPRFLTPKSNTPSKSYTPNESNLSCQSNTSSQSFKPWHSRKDFHAFPPFTLKDKVNLNSSPSNLYHPYTQGLLANPAPSFQSSSPTKSDKSDYPYKHLSEPPSLHPPYISLHLHRNSIPDDKKEKPKPQIYTSLFPNHLSSSTQQHSSLSNITASNYNNYPTYKAGTFYPSFQYHLSSPPSSTPPPNLINLDYNHQHLFKQKQNPTNPPNHQTIFSSYPNILNEQPKSTLYSHPHLDRFSGHASILGDYHLACQNPMFCLPHHPHPPCGINIHTADSSSNDNQYPSPSSKHRHSLQKLKPGVIVPLPPSLEKLKPVVHSPHPSHAFISSFPLHLQSSSGKCKNSFSPSFLLQIANKSSSKRSIFSSRNLSRSNRFNEPFNHSLPFFSSFFLPPLFGLLSPKPSYAYSSFLQGRFRVLIDKKVKRGSSLRLKRCFDFLLSDTSAGNRMAFDLFKSKAKKQKTRVFSSFGDLSKELEESALSKNSFLMENRIRGAVRTMILMEAYNEDTENSHLVDIRSSGDGLDSYLEEEPFGHKNINKANIDQQQIVGRDYSKGPNNYPKRRSLLDINGPADSSADGQVFLGRLNNSHESDHDMNLILLEGQKFNGPFVYLEEQDKDYTNRAKPTEETDLENKPMDISDDAVEYDELLGSPKMSMEDLYGANSDDGPELVDELENGPTNIPNDAMDNEEHTGSPMESTEFPGAETEHGQMETDLDHPMESADNLGLD